MIADIIILIIVFAIGVWIGMAFFNDIDKEWYEEQKANIADLEARIMAMKVLEEVK